jgi:hypothetical protein
VADEKKPEVRAPSNAEGDPDAHNEHGEPGVRPNSTADGEPVEKKIVVDDD